jgi:hypothetical protein
MIIDADTHISPLPEGGIGITAETLVERMDKAGVNKALSWPYYPYDRSRLADYCQYIYQSVKTFPDRIAGFGWIDPTLGMEGALHLTRTCMEEYGLYGVKLNGGQNLYRYDNMSITAPIVETVARAGGIVAMHVGADSPRFTHPYFAGRLAQAYPETDFLMIHMGGVTYPDLSDCAIETAQNTPNILLVGSHAGDLSIMKAIQAVGADRVCFASDSPFALMHVETAKYHAMLCDTAKENKDKIMGGNIAKILQKKDK